MPSVVKMTTLNQEVSRIEQGVPGVNQIKIHRETPKIINKIMKYDQAYDHFASSLIPMPITKIFPKQEPHHMEEMYSKEIICMQRYHWIYGQSGSSIERKTNICSPPDIHS